MKDDKPYELIDLPRVNDPRGNLSFIQGDSQIPFEIERVYWIYDVPGGKARGGHALKHTTELIVALSGSFDVILDMGDGHKHRVHMSRSYKGLIIPAMCWREVDAFSTNSVAVLLASTCYDPADYIYDYQEFIKASNKQ